MRGLAAACTGLLAVSAVSAQPAPAPAWSWTSPSATLEGGVDTYTAFYAMRGTWWNLASAAAPDFDLQRRFGELWVHPRLTGRHRTASGTEWRGGLSLGLTRTIGEDALGYEDEGEARVGLAMLGVRGRVGDWAVDLSLGRQPFTLGTGMLLTAGSGNGGTWGGGASTQRQAWGRTVLAEAGRGEWTGTIFAIEPDELPESRTDTRVHGVAIEWERPKAGRAGLSWFTVPRSSAIYPGDLAPLVFIQDGREGVNTWYGWADVTGLVPGLPALGLRAEYARQRNEITRVGGRRDPMKASAWLLGASWWAQQLPFAPRFSLHLARASGDKPGTATFERFDPMYWGNGLDNWWFGANGAYAWLNSNLRTRRFIVDAYVSPRDILQFQLVQAKVDQVNSAIQFGQGARFSDNGLLIGVPVAELSDEFYLQYARVFSAQWVGIAFVSRSLPGDGLKASAPQGTTPWTTVGLGLTATF